MRARLLTLLVPLLLMAGCIALPTPEAATTEAPATGAASGDARMSAQESVRESVEPCDSGSHDVCASRTHEVQGRLALERLDVSLSTFNGPIEVEAGSAGAWSMRIVLHASGDTEEEARAALQRIQLSWSHEDKGRHFLDVEAKVRDRASGDLGASVRVTLPSTLLVEAALATTNGPVEFEGLRASGLAVQTTNGAVSLRASAANVAVTTTNGGIDAQLTPTATGSITLGTTNGGIDLALPEDAQRGYDLTASTTNGQVDIDLQDGRTTRAGNSATFRTNGFDERPLRSAVGLTSTNGAIDVSPA